MSETESAASASLVLITGLSGSGKSTVANCFEDLGYYVTDNLPMPMLERFLAEPLELSGGHEQIAVVADCRSAGFAEAAPRLWRAVDRDRIRPTLVFLESSEEALVRRFSESRRPHPLGTDVPVEEAIRRERAMMTELRGAADVVFDSSEWSVHEMRSLVYRQFGREAGHQPEMAVSLVSFGFKHGTPSGTDLTFDVRFLPNPHYIDGLRQLPGTDSRVIEYLTSQRDFPDLVERLGALLLFLLPRYRQENRSYLTISIGCTGGRHRSVAVSEQLAEMLRSEGWMVNIRHRDLGKAIA